MTGRVRSGLVWVASATVILAGGFAVFVLAASRLAASGTSVEARAALAVWAWIVLIKGLLPQLWLCLALWPLADRWLGLRARGGLGLAAGLAVAALLAGAPVAAWLLTLPLPGLPAVVFRGPGNYAATVLEMSVPVWLAALAPALVLRACSDAAPLSRT